MWEYPSDTEQGKLPIRLSSHISPLVSDQDSYAGCQDMVELYHRSWVEDSIGEFRLGSNGGREIWEICQ